MEPPRNKASIATAKFIPIFLLLVIAYASYVITGPLAIEYLLNPPKDVAKRISVGLAIPIAYLFLLIPVGATWLRLLIVVWWSPGYVPLGEAPDDTEGDPAPGLEKFWLKDVFSCDSEGMPIWCSRCHTWKPDRAHHNQDVGRCTMKMDHFCPWVGGVVGERSYKFFVQFNFYSFLLSGYGTGVLAYFVAERKENSGLEIQWLVALGLAGFFALFTLGMFGNCLWMIFRNVTTIENIDYHSRTQLLAVLLPPDLQEQDLHGPPLPPQAHLRSEISPSGSGESGRPLTSEIDDPSHSTYFSNLHTPRPRRRESVLPHQDKIWKGTVSYPLHLPSDRPPLPAPHPRTFAILETLPGMNVWDLGSSWQNFKAVFGSELHDWLLPIKHSPCCDHSSEVSQFPLGPDFEELLIEAGLVPRPASRAPSEKGRHSNAQSSTVSRKRKRKRRLDGGWQHGERPDGWISDKEARRQRNEARRSSQGIPLGSDVLR